MQVRMLLAAFLFALALSPAFGLTGPITTVDIPGTSAGLKTGIYVLPGDVLNYEAFGQVNTLPPSPFNLASPEGNGNPCTASCLLPSAQFGALIGRIGDQGTWFLMGFAGARPVTQAGMFYLAVNDTIYTDNTGEFTADIGIIAGTASCVPAADALCLDGNRFRVQIFWSLDNGIRGSGQVAPCGTSDSGLMWFFGPTNWEVLVKVLNACPVNQQHWVFAAATTTVEFTLRIWDTHTGVVRMYFNPSGRAADALTDVSAFDCS